jgi:hypothetical protein
MSDISTILLQRCIEGGSLPLSNRDGHLAGGKHFDQSEVNELDNPIGGQFEISWFDISVENGGRLVV